MGNSGAQGENGFNVCASPPELFKLTHPLGLRFFACFPNWVCASAATVAMAKAAERNSGARSAGASLLRMSARGR